MKAAFRTTTPSASRRADVRIDLLRRHACSLFGAALLIAAPTALRAAATGIELPGRESYASERRIAIEQRIPLVLMFSLPGCPWCARVRSEQLQYLYRDRDRIGVRIVELSLADTVSLAGIDGDNSPAQIARALGVRVAPSVLFLAPEGEIAERLVGYPSADFYGAYLDTRVHDARRRLGHID